MSKEFSIYCQLGFPHQQSGHRSEYLLILILKNDTCPECLTSSADYEPPSSRASAPYTPKLTGLAQLQLNKKGIASVKTQFTNMTSPLPWLEI